MIKVAFLGETYSKEWMGGVNYINNLLYAISTYEDKKIEPIVFFGKKIDNNIKEKLSLNAKIVQDSVFDRKSIKWYVSKILKKLFNINWIIENLLEKHNIKVISHSNIFDNFNSFKKINWIPDFQHVHLPSFFSDKDNKSRDMNFKISLNKSDSIIVSSFNAYEDAKKFSPENIHKVNVLQFVSQPNKKFLLLSPEYIQKLEKKYKFNGDFFYLPNQFWTHKNHMFVFKAVNELKKRGINILVLCSGYMNDYRNPLYIDEIKGYIEKNGLEENIKLLGLIDYDDVLYFMKYSVAVINPSLFEGWSSTVEECKSIGKNMILSDIKIHREQNPENSLYFNPQKTEDFISIVEQVLKKQSIDKINKLDIKAEDNLKYRTKEFARNYQNIVLSTLLDIEKNDI